jgi:preprotein translocase subunit SecA
MNALKAKEFYRRDVQYIVRNGKALIINEVFIQSLILYVFIT